ncbi:hypothetical protein [Nocardia sputorum]|uniref:DUF222 domain-containing protein n=1 Tax=Nocardia sputorum TaxID=2984338 RepID=A0ABM8D2V4_9NOCA|nr:hypothetical protein [Nocardia sputorum]BDU01698.1 hypothetical protein IFM12276_47260 [Nocardia sputorum]
MSQPSRIDTGELRVLVSTLERLIVDASRTVGELKAAIASAEALVGDGLDRAEVAFTPAAVEIPAAEVAPEAADAPERKAMPTPWARKTSATPWSRRVVRPCPTVPSAPVRASAPPEVAAVELSAPLRPSAARSSKYESAARRTDALDNPASVRRTDAADGSAPPGAITVDSALIQRPGRADRSAPADRTDDADVRRTDLPEAFAPMHRTDVARHRIDAPGHPTPNRRTDAGSRQTALPDDASSLRRADATSHRRTDLPEHSAPIHRTDTASHRRPGPPDTSGPIEPTGLSTPPVETAGFQSRNRADGGPRRPRIDAAERAAFVPEIDVVLRLPRANGADTGTPHRHTDDQRPKDYPAEAEPSPESNSAPIRQTHLADESTSAPTSNSSSAPTSTPASDRFAPHQHTDTADDRRPENRPENARPDPESDNGRIRGTRLADESTSAPTGNSSSAPTSTPASDRFAPHQHPHTADDRRPEDRPADAEPGPGNNSKPIRQTRRADDSPSARPGGPEFDSAPLPEPTRQTGDRHDIDRPGGGTDSGEAVRTVETSAPQRDTAPSTETRSTIDTANGVAPSEKTELPHRPEATRHSDIKPDSTATPADGAADDAAPKIRTPPLPAQVGIVGGSGGRRMAGEPDSTSSDSTSVLRTDLPDGSATTPMLGGSAATPTIGGSTATPMLGASVPPTIGAPVPPIEPADSPAVPQPAINPDDSVPTPRKDVAERPTSAPEAHATSHPDHIAHSRAANHPAARPADATFPHATDEPVSRRRTDTGSTATQLIDALRFSWIDASPDPRVGSPGAATTDPTSQTESDPQTGKTDSWRQPSGSTQACEVSGRTGNTAPPAPGPQGESALIPQPGRTDAAALGRRPDAPHQPTPIDDTTSAHRPVPPPRSVPADGSDRPGPAQHSTRAPRTDDARPRQAVPRITGSANSAPGSASAPQHTDSTRDASTRTNSAPARNKGRAPLERTGTAHRAAAPEPTGPDPSEALRIAREMSARHGLEVVGFDAATVDVQVIREIASALDELLTKYPIPLRGVELTDDAESRPRPARGPAEQSAESAIWIVLDRAALNPPAPVETRRIFRRRGPAERPVYTAVAREFAGALDAAGGFRARQEALRTLINESLRGGGGGLGLLDPGRALIDGFTEVVLRGERAGASAKELHGALVKMARAESSDGLTA